VIKPGESFDRYTIETVLGQGGMGCVYRAHDIRLDRRVALKLVLPDDDADDATRADAKARLLREARAAAALDHPNAVAIYDVGEVETTPYIAMELVAGKTLRSAIDEGKTPLPERVRWLLDVARALAAAHRAGLVHRDVKPENVMVRPDGRVKVLDFGIARRSAVEVDPSAPTQASGLATLTARGIQVGTPMYMAPEQIRGEPVDGRSDQFSWGVLAYELITGKIPWKSKDTLSLVAAVLTQDPPPMRGAAPDIGDTVAATVRRALSKSPADRFASMDDIVRALESGADSGASDPPPRLRGTTDLRRYDTRELQEILQRALEHEEHDGKFSHGDLVEAAREVGIDEAALRAAWRELEREGRTEPPDARRAREKKKLQRHAAMWAVFSLFFYLLDMLTSGGVWFYYPMLGWGVGVAAHAVRYFFPVDPSPRRDKRKRKGKQKPGDVDEHELEEGVSVLLRATERRARIAAGSEPRPRVRVGAPDDDPIPEEVERREERARRLRAP